MNADKKSTQSRKVQKRKADLPLDWIDVKYCLEVPTKPSRHSGCDGVNMKYLTRIPAFAVQIGFWVTVCRDDDFREIEQVYWSEHEGLVIFLKFDEQAKVSRLKNLGWQMDEV